MISYRLLLLYGICSSRALSSSNAREEGSSTSEKMPVASSLFIPPAMPTSLDGSSIGTGKIIQRYQIGLEVNALIEYEDASDEPVAMTLKGTVTQYDDFDVDKYEFTTVDLEQQQYEQTEQHLQNWKAYNEENEYWSNGDGSTFGIVVDKRDMRSTRTVGLYDLLKALGQGAFGVVYEVYKTGDKDDVRYALKEMKNMNVKQLELAQKETAILSKLKHENIVEFIDSFTYEGSFYMVMAIANYGDLSKLIRQQKRKNKPWPKAFILLMLDQVVSGLKQAHKLNVIHGDLKPANILVRAFHSEDQDDWEQAPEAIQLMISDFGLARAMETSKDCGTRCYMSAEAHEGKYSFATDIWSIGCILYELCMLKLLISDKTMSLIRHGNIPQISKTSNQGEDWTDLQIMCNHMLNREDPEARPSCLGILQHVTSMHINILAAKMYSLDYISDGCTQTEHSEEAINRKASNDQKCTYQVDDDVYFWDKEKKEFCIGATISEDLGHDEYRIRFENGKERQTISQRLKLRERQNDLTMKYAIGDVVNVWDSKRKKFCSRATVTEDLTDGKYEVRCADGTEKDIGFRRLRPFGDSSLSNMSTGVSARVQPKTAGWEQWQRNGDSVISVPSDPVKIMGSAVSEDDKKIVHRSQSSSSVIMSLGNGFSSTPQKPSVSSVMSEGMEHRFQINDQVSARIEFHDVNNQCILKTIYGTIEQYDLEDIDKYEFHTLDLQDDEYVDIEKHLENWKAYNEEENDYWVVKAGRRLGMTLSNEVLQNRFPTGLRIVGMYELFHQLGVGAFGIVYEVCRTGDLDGKRYALKEMKNMGTKQLEFAQKEADILSKLKHENIVEYVDSFDHGGAFYMVMALANHGDLRGLIRIRKKRDKNRHWPTKFIVYMLEQIVSGLNHAHEQRVIHRDLKPDNILVRKLVSNLEEGWEQVGRAIQLKIGDFGLARKLTTSRDHASSQVGTRYYMSPEAHGGNYFLSTDIWSLGCIFYELCMLELAIPNFEIMITGAIPEISNKSDNDEDWLELKQMCTQNRKKMLNKNDATARPTCKIILKDVEAIQARSEVNAQLCRAAQNENFEMVKTLAKDGADLKVISEFSKKVLEQAVQNKDDRMVEILVTAGADINEQLVAASKDKDLKLIKLFLQAVPDITPHLLQAAKENNFNLIEMFFTVGADVSAITDAHQNDVAAVMRVAACKSRFDIIEVLFRAGADTDMVVLQAAKDQNFEHVEKLFEMGADLSVITKSHEVETDAIICLAIEKDRFDMLQVLISNGADVDLHLEQYIRQDNQGVIQKLFTAGADISKAVVSCTKTDLDCVIHAAIHADRFDMVEALVTAGADIQIQVRDALNKDDVDLVHKLVIAGAETSLIENFQDILKQKDAQREQEKQHLQNTLSEERKARQRQEVASRNKEKEYEELMVKMRQDIEREKHENFQDILKQKEESLQKDFQNILSREQDKHRRERARQEVASRNKEKEYEELMLKMRQDIEREKQEELQKMQGGHQNELRAMEEKFKLAQDQLDSRIQQQDNVIGELMQKKADGELSQILDEKKEAVQETKHEEQIDSEDGKEDGELDQWTGGVVVGPVVRTPGGMSRKVGNNWEVDMSHVQARSMKVENFRKEPLPSPKSKYTKPADLVLGFDELKDSQNPQVDPTRTEQYLSDEDFQKHFGMSREEFNAIPKWKQNNKKKDVGLY